MRLDSVTERIPNLPEAAKADDAEFEALVAKEGTLVGIAGHGDHAAQAGSRQVQPLVRPQPAI